MLDEIPSSGDPLRQARMRSLADALQAVVRRVQDAAECGARQEKMHPTDFRCIGFLHSAGRPLSPKEIIAHLGISSGSGTALLDRLEANGYIRRLPNPDDRRGVLIALDAAAASDVLATYERLRDGFLEATEGLSNDQIETIASFLRNVSSLHDRLV